MDYERRDDSLWYSGRIDSGETLALCAANIRRQHTGVHARVSVWLDGQMLEWDTLNVERREDRVRLANSAHKRLGNIGKEIVSANRLELSLSRFCAGLWDGWQGTRRAEDVSVSELTAVEFVLEPFVLVGGGTIIFAPPGTGKTTIGMMMCRCIETGLGYPWPIPATRRCLYVQLERSPVSHGRNLYAVNRALGLPPDSTMFSLVRRGATLMDVADTIRDHVRHDDVEVVFLDSISRAGAGSLNKDDTANSIMDTLNAVAPTWVALAHTSQEGRRKQEDAHAFGSIMFDAAADVVVQLISEERPNLLGVAMKITKANDIPKGKSQLLALEFDSYGVSGVRKPSPNEFDNLAAVGMSFSDRVRHHLGRIGKGTASEIAEGIGAERSNVSRLLSTALWAVKFPDGRKVVYALRDDHE